MRIVIIILLSLFANSAKSQSSSILDLVVIGKDTIVASTYDMSIIVSHDGGKTWITTERQLMKKLGLDGKRIWGIDSWIGIHERSYSRLFYSDDIGKTWKQIELNTDLFFAMDFIEIGGRFWIVDAQSDIWEHKVTNVETSLSWKKRTSFNDFGRLSILSSYRDSYLKISGLGDSLWVFDTKAKKLIRSKSPIEDLELAVLLNNSIVYLLDGKDSQVFQFDLKEQKLNSITKVEGYKWFSSFSIVGNTLFVLGEGNDGRQDFTVLSMINSQGQLKIIDGVKGGDADVCFIDKYNRLWIGTTKGMFLLEPGSDKSKQIL
ncbi:exo-alpha-sialidase [Lacibacter luteus]|uniref:Exo-alpha-sialidase n=1 Tax=Lacibacter luteus TaxID=2508719 RepID=A0A4Q1CMR7_9BACT|nr:sialidase family protein [Lacibacter luteus]RXK61909.1 exo-alpha-sialidase [Lacibacter luteus]